MSEEENNWEEEFEENEDGEITITKTEFKEIKYALKNKTLQQAIEVVEEIEKESSGTNKSWENKGMPIPINVQGTFDVVKDQLKQLKKGL